MRRSWKFFSSLLAVSVLSAGAASSAAAGPLDLDDDDDGSKSPSSKDEGLGTYKPPVATIKGHTFTLAECLALTDRNHPNLWAARARLASTHAQLDEAKWLPFWQWNAGSNFGVLSAGNVIFSERWLYLPSVSVCVPRSIVPVAVLAILMVLTVVLALSVGVPVISELFVPASVPSPTKAA